MTGMTPDPLQPNSDSALQHFFALLESRTTDPVHKRLVTAAKAPAPGPALERELELIMNTIINEA